MSEEPIVLQKIFVVIGTITHFTTKPHISNKELFDFFNDLSRIVKELDPEINYEGKIRSVSDEIWYKSRFLKQYSQLEKSLQVDGEKRIHKITYQRTPLILPPGEMYKDIEFITPNITLTSMPPTYQPPDLVSRIKRMPGVMISERFSIFDPNEMIAVGRGERLNKVLMDGKVFDYVRCSFD